MPRLGAALFLLCAVAFAAPATLVAHDIPSDVTIQAFVKPEPNHLHLLVRVPLRAMRDVVYPPKGAPPNRETAPYLDLARADRTLGDAAMLWIGQNVYIYEGDRRLPPATLAAVHASQSYDESFRSYERAKTHISGPRLPDDTNFVWADGLLDVAFDYPIDSDRAAFSIDPRFARLGVRTMTIVRFVPPDGAVRAFEFQGDPGLVRLDPRWHQAALTFVKLGFSHILDGADHLLFLLCLVIPFRRFRSLVAVVTSFTVAHSITLLASAYDVAPGALWFPPLIETLIAMSIVYMALENIVGASLHRRWLITFAFGLVHGFGFSFALKQTLQFAGTHLLTSLLAFNVGVELGQLLVLLVAIPALDLLFRYVVAERMGTILMSAFVAHTGWHWMADRFDRLRQYTFTWPVLDYGDAVTAVRWLMLAVVVLGVLWVMSIAFGERRPRDERGPFSLRPLR